MNWLFIAIIAHFLFALVFIVDKFIVSKTALQPVAYAFYTGLLQIFVLVLIPFGFKIPPLEQIIISFIAGALFTFAVLFLYKSFQLGQVSRIAPVIGGSVPIFTLILTYSFLGERLTFYQLIAFCLFVLGGIIILWPQKEKIQAVKSSLSKRLFIVFLSALLFAGSFVLTKFIFTHQPFINGFIWIRLGGVLGTILLFFWPGNIQRILEAAKIVKIRTIGVFSANKSLSAVAFILLNYAIFLGSVSLVNALQGIQYVFLLIIIAILSKKFPEIIKEKISNRIVAQKIIAILFIALGLGILMF